MNFNILLYGCETIMAKRCIPFWVRKDGRPIRWRSGSGALDLGEDGVRGKRPLGGAFRVKDSPNAGVYLPIL